MIDSRNLFNGENVESLKKGAGRRAEGVIEQLEAKLRDIGATNRLKVQKEVLAEVLLNTYMEGRLSSMMDFEQQRRMDAVNNAIATAKSQQDLASGLIQQELAGHLERITTLYGRCWTFLEWILIGQGIVTVLSITVFVMKCLGK